MKTNRLNPALIIAGLALVLVLFVAHQGSAEQRSHASAPMRIVTEGSTAQEHMQREGELSRRLQEDFPSAAATFRAGLTAEEVSAIDRRSEVPLRIGVVKALPQSIELFGLMRNANDRLATRGKSEIAIPTREGGFVWAAVITTKNAGAIRLHIEDMSLPRGVELYFYSRDGQAYGPYTASGPHSTGEFWTSTIFGAEAILQLKIPAGVKDLSGVSVHVREAGMITPRFAGGLQESLQTQAPPPPGWPCGNANCVVDATCLNTTIADSLSLAVAKIEWIQGAYIYTCTGGLISDNNPSQSNFFLTANHCISKNNSAKNANFYWRFATSSCNASSCPSNSGWAFQSSGATVSATNRKGDFSLLHLNSAPPSGSVTLGWTPTPVANSNGTVVYRVSNPNFGPQVYSEHRVDTSAPTCSTWPRGERIYSRDITGAIDGGSSGSPIVNSSLQIVGQLSGTCGLNPSSVCSSGPGEDNATVDGAFAFYFSTVQPILNP